MSASASYKRPLWQLAPTLLLLAGVGIVSLHGAYTGVTPVSAAAGQVFKMTTVGSTFTLGRCFRVDFRLQTDSMDINSADLVVPYDTAVLEPHTNATCTSVATQALTDGLFPAYPSPGNVISGGVIQVTGADFGGTSPVNTGVNPADSLFAHIFFKVLSTDPSYDLEFDFTLTDTTDTNAAEQDGDGTDVLDSVENLTLALIPDTTPPYFTSPSPAINATGVDVTGDLSVVANDSGAGLKTDTLTMSFNGSPQSVSVTGCTTTNSNRITPCTVSATIPTLAYNTTYSVTATGSDAAVSPNNTGSLFWQFTTEDDDDAPYVTGRNPAPGATGVTTASNVVFHIKDYKNQADVVPGLGVDIDSVKVTLTVLGVPTTYGNGSGAFSFTGTSEDYTITINPATDFPIGATISVDINGRDLHGTPNVMSTVSYSFTTADDTGPTIIAVSPIENETDVVPTANVVVRFTDSGAGVDLAGTTITVGGTGYTLASSQWTSTGSSTDYTVTINPTNAFRGGNTISVSVATEDTNVPANAASKNYSFTVDGTCDTCFVDDENPARFSSETEADQDIVLHINDTGVGIDISSIVIELVGDGDAFPSSPLTLSGSHPYLTITGTSGDYTITINLPADLLDGSPVGIRIDADDLYGRSMTTVAYTFSVGSVTEVAAACPDVVASSDEGGGGGGGRRGTPEQSQERIEDLIAQWVERRLSGGTLVPGGVTPEDVVVCIEQKNAQPIAERVLERARRRGETGPLWPAVAEENAPVNQPSVITRITPVLPSDILDFFSGTEFSSFGESDETLRGAAPARVQDGIVVVIPWYVYYLVLALGIVLIFLALILFAEWIKRREVRVTRRIGKDAEREDRE